MSHVYPVCQGNNNCMSVFGQEIHESVMRDVVVVTSSLEAELREEDALLENKNRQDDKS